MVLKSAPFGSFFLYLMSKWLAFYWYLVLFEWGTIERWPLCWWFSREWLGQHDLRVTEQNWPKHDLDGLCVSHHYMIPRSELKLFDMCLTDCFIIRSYSYYTDPSIYLHVRVYRFLSDNDAAVISQHTHTHSARPGAAWPLSSTTTHTKPT